jgi:hypothetical protein
MLNQRIGDKLTSSISDKIKSIFSWLTLSLKES